MAEDPYPSCRFYVETGTDKQAVFTEVSGLQVEMDVMSYEEGGTNGFVHRLPGRSKMGNLTLKRGMTCSNDFLTWYAQIARGAIKRRNLSVVLYDVSGKEMLRWNFVNAYPVKWSGPQFTADGSAAAIETLELAHEGLKLE